MRIAFLSKRPVSNFEHKFYEVLAKHYAERQKKEQSRAGKKLVNNRYRFINITLKKKSINTL